MIDFIVCKNSGGGWSVMLAIRDGVALLIGVMPTKRLAEKMCTHLRNQFRKAGRETHFKILSDIRSGLL